MTTTINRISQSGDLKAIVRAMRRRFRRVYHRSPESVAAFTEPMALFVIASAELKYAAALLLKEHGGVCDYYACQDARGATWTVERLAASFMSCLCGARELLDLWADSDKRRQKVARSM